jgi:hypothetical protein
MRTLRLVIVAGWLLLSTSSLFTSVVDGAEAPTFTKVSRFSVGAGGFPCDIVCDGNRNLIFAQGGLGVLKVTKLDSAGQTIWTKGFPVDCADCFGIAVDGQNNLLLTGYFLNSATFGSTTLQTASPVGDSDLFVLKLDPSGNVVFVIHAARKAPPCKACGEAIGTDQAGNIFVAGAFWGTCDFGRIQLRTRAANNGKDAFCAKWSSTGKELWAARLGELAIQVDGREVLAASAQTQPSPGNVSSLVVGPQGDCRLHYGGKLWTYLADGSFSQAVAVGVMEDQTTLASAGGTAVDTSGNCFVTGNSGTAAGLVKVGPQGRVLWTKTLAASNPGPARGYDVTVDREGNAIVAGSFAGTLDSGKGTVTSAGQSDVFVAAFNPAGDLLWMTSAGGPGDDNPRGVVVNFDRRIWIAGLYGGGWSESAKASFGGIDLPAPTDGQSVYVAGMTPTSGQ